MAEHVTRYDPTKYDHTFDACPYPKGCTGCESRTCFQCDATGWLTEWDERDRPLHYPNAECPYCDGRGRVSPETDRQNHMDEDQRIAESTHP